MPIAFPSISHGQIPIGFFNIETDMLLMDRYFFFSTDFCEWIMVAADTGGIEQSKKTIYMVEKREMIGNLAGAIHGYEFTGFIGEIYKLFPFPENPAGFKQKPYGNHNRSIVEKTIQPFAQQKDILIVFRQDSATIDFGDYTFSTEVFHDLIEYVQAGGMPGWLNGQPPDYVNEMITKLLWYMG